MKNWEYMKTILEHECGKANAEFSSDESIADELESTPASEKNGKIVYRSTCDYTMVSPENETETETSLFDCSGS